MWFLSGYLLGAKLTSNFTNITLTGTHVDIVFILGRVIKHKYSLEKGKHNLIQMFTHCDLDFLSKRNNKMTMHSPL